MIKRKMSLLLAAVLVATGVAAAPALADTTAQKLPEIMRAVPSISMAEVGDDFSYAVTAKNFDGDVQYRIWYQNLATKEWGELTDGYSEAVPAGQPFIPAAAETLPEGQYKAVIWVKRAGVDGVNKNANGSWDNIFTRTFKIQKDGYFDGRAKLDNLGLKDTYKVGEYVTIEGADNYKIHTLDSNGVWTNDADYEKAEGASDDVKFDKPGIYMIDVWGITDNPTEAVKKQGYGGLALKVIEVVEEQGIAVGSSIKEAMFGSLLTINAEYPGAVKYQAYKDGEVLTKVTDLGKEASVFPAMAEGEEIEVKLLNAAGSVVATTKLNIGETAYVAAPEVKEVNVTATVKEAMFGSLVSVEADLEGAVSFQLVDANDEVLTKVTEIGKEASVFPAMKAGDEVKVNLLDAEGNVLQTVETALK